MLPSFRLITATFFCGFLIVFAGLRLAASLNDFHEGVPVLAAHAAPISIAMADTDPRHGSQSGSVTFDLRFAVSPASPSLAATPTPAAIIGRAAPLLPVVPVAEHVIAPAAIPDDAAPAASAPAAVPAANPDVAPAATPTVAPAQPQP